ncbi:MAG: ankyrin repeat domain-containing protein [Alphaproteobacteria bacterium]|nr:ankyrin repeat domain-containing protein [Alphaproteobacteria bacterium]
MFLKFLDKSASVKVKNLTEELLSELNKSGRSKPADIERCRQLIDAGADVNARDEGDRNQPLLMVAIRLYQKEVAGMLLERGASPNDGDDRGDTPLRYASCFRGDYDLALKLIDAGADVNVKNKHGRTALMEAVEHNQVNFVEKLLLKGADVNACDTIGVTSLMYAAAAGYLEITRFLLEKGADVEAVSKVGSTAADYARISKEFKTSNQASRFDDVMTLLEEERVGAVFQEAAKVGTSRARKIIRRKPPIPSQVM